MITARPDSGGEDPGPAYFGAEVLAGLAARHRVMAVDGAAVHLGQGVWSFSAGYRGDRLQVIVAVAGTAVVPVRPVTDAELDAAHYPGYAREQAMLRKVGMDRPEDYDLDDGN